MTDAMLTITLLEDIAQVGQKCDQIWENPLNAANNFFQYHRVKPYGSIFFKKNFMAEMDRHQLALAYDAVVSSGLL